MLGSGVRFLLALDGATNPLNTEYEAHKYSNTLPTAAINLEINQLRKRVHCKPEAKKRQHACPGMNLIDAT